MQDSTSMPPLNPPTPPASDPVPPASDPVPPVSDPVPPVDSGFAPVENTSTPLPSDDSLAQVVDRVNKGDNILVALSKNPSVDELTAAIALTMYLDKYGKHATAIFSGKTPNAIKFLRPEETLFENTDSLQDFIVALNKEKADHLRYKLEGDFVKVYITPYKTKIDEKDLEFSYGEYNVDLVIALNVPTRDDLDAALSEHGRIMHDATAININAGPPQTFGDLEWGDPAASSVSEMVFHLIEQLDKGEKLLDASMSNALLAGLISATDRFSNARTSSEAMSIASRLLESGADQQMVSAKIADGERTDKAGDAVIMEFDENPGEGASISINHDAQKSENKEAETNTQDLDLSATLDQLISAPASEPENMPDPMPLSEPEPMAEPEPVIESEPASEPEVVPEPELSSSPLNVPEVEAPTASEPIVEPHLPTSSPDFSVAPPSLPGSEAPEPMSSELSAPEPVPEPASAEASVPVSAPEPTSSLAESIAQVPEPAPTPTPEPSSAPESIPIQESEMPEMPHASSSLDSLLPPPPPPPAAPNISLPEPSVPTANFNPQIPEPTIPTTAPVEPAPNLANSAPQPAATPVDSIPSISSFQIPDTGQDEGIFGDSNSN